MKRRRARWRLGAAALGVAASLAVSALSIPTSAQSGATPVPATTSTVASTSVPTTVPAMTTTVATTTTVPATTTTVAMPTLATTTTVATTTTSTVPPTTSTTAVTATTAAVSSTTTTTTPNETAIIADTDAPPPGAPGTDGSPGTPGGPGTTVPAVPRPAAEEEVPGAGEVAGDRAPTRVQGAGVPPPAPVVALEVPPPGRPAPPAVSSRQVAEVLEAAAARRRDLNARVVDAEATVVRLDAEVVSANSALAAARAEHEDVAARLASAEAERRRHERASLTVPVPPATVEEPPKPAPRRNPLASLWSRAVNVGRSLIPDRPASAVRVPDGVRARDEVRRRGAELSVAVTDLRQRLERAQHATAAADAELAAKTVELEDARRALAVARAALSSAIADVTFGPAALGATLGTGGSASDLALADIPADYLPVYQAAAAACSGLSWTVLAAVGAIESAHGRAAAPGVREGANYAGAMGPMQFLAPTWAAYGLDGDGDGTADVYNPVDAVYGAANYLCASGGGDPGRLGGALWAYNHADWYVRDVLDLATRYGGASLRTTALDGAQLLANPNLVVTPEAAADLAAGRVDDRVVAALGAVVARHRIKVSVFESGHSMYVKGTDRVSNHYYGRAVDIYEVDGAPVSASNDRALDLAVSLLTAESSLRPDELGSPWPELSQFPGAFSDADHAGHLHLGWRAPDGRTGESQP